MVDLLTGGLKRLPKACCVLSPKLLRNLIILGARFLYFSTIFTIFSVVDSVAYIMFEHIVNEFDTNDCINVVTRITLKA